jgi:hypothetical protein
MVFLKQKVRNVFSFHNVGMFGMKSTKNTAFFWGLPSPNPNFVKLSRPHKTSIKNISASLTFYAMGHEAPEWPRSDLESYELGAPDPKNFRYLGFF